MRENLRVQVPLIAPVRGDFAFVWAGYRRPSCDATFGSFNPILCDRQVEVILPRQPCILSALDFNGHFGRFSALLRRSKCHPWVCRFGASSLPHWMSRAHASPNAYLGLMPVCLRLFGGARTRGARDSVDARYYGRVFGECGEEGGASSWDAFEPDAAA
jgi:hypothetical protein